MKFVILLGLIAFAAAQQHGGTSLLHLITNEIHGYVRENSAITVAECTAKCDSAFGTLVAADETLTDQDCAMECRRIIGGGHVAHTTTAAPN